ncbi:hypothetical protein GH741_19270 [Aquibacillus halophilus]|uniref:Peptidase C39-like domain-containing protein n=1 Tax=Aquibacillus halophilus TaxID=930132 RepID=A0A6A8DGK6_9BACI|nr:C39 family peptidase [Aquibacillus halophilus]MRH44794.1 hypothetical protein [Aquibacillus halophilus]
MLFFLMFFTILMTLLLFYLLRTPLQYVYKSALKTYIILFGLSSLMVTGIILYNSKSTIYDWLKNQSDKSYTYATELPETELEIVLPPVELVQLRPDVRLDAPIVGQHPELPRGCEVTSLAMLLQYFQVDVEKMELAEKVKKDNTPYKVTSDGIFFGNPSNGFVGDMYSFSNPGLGVYHEPIAELAKQYLGDQVLDFSGGSFYEVLQHLNQDRPVWIITNTLYKELPETEFETWQTDDGPIEITMREHSVLVTGYDEEFIYFNDPILAETRKAPFKSFEEAWVQMGKQAITVITP